MKNLLRLIIALVMLARLTVPPGVYADVISPPPLDITSCIHTISPNISGAPNDEAWGINNSGNIVGFSADQYFGSGNTNYAWIYNIGTGNFTICTYPGSLFTKFYGINNNNLIVGTYGDNSSSTISYAISYDGSTYNSYQIPNGYNTYANGINGATIVGNYSDNNQLSHGFTYTGGSLTYPVDYINGGLTYQTQLQGINQSGIMVGFYLDSSNIPHGLIRYADGTFQTIDVIWGTLGTILYGINNNWILGAFYNDSGYHGFIYHTLGDYYYSLAANNVIQIEGNGFNDNLQMVGFYLGADGYEHAFYTDSLAGILTDCPTDPPSIPIPATYLLFGSALASLALWRWKCRQR